MKVNNQGPSQLSIPQNIGQPEVLVQDPQRTNLLLGPCNLTCPLVMLNLRYSLSVHLAYQNIAAVATFICWSRLN